MGEGEKPVETPTVRSYYARYWRKDGKLLLGGLSTIATSRFQRKGDLIARLENANVVHDGEVRAKIFETATPPEIFVHCGYAVGTVGGRCPNCMKTLTVKDAMAVSAIA